MRHSRALGFSLIELMVTIAIVAILLAVAFPSFEGSMRSNRVATGSNELMASLALARSESIRSPGGSSLCASASGTACDGTWNDGWIVWPDINGNGVLDAGERVLRFVEANDKLNFTATATQIRFDSRGRSFNSAANTVTLMPSNCPLGQELVRTVALTPTGQARISKGSCT